ncbi:MAG: hypothetical protein GWP17_00120 [Aquificales bacterium]|nr:hypothetical protein [Aquificales bacterium]
MTVIVLVNIGSRDLLLNDDSLFPAREEGEKVWTQYATVKDKLTFPILQPPLTQILGEVSYIDRLFLFGTDQDEQTDEKYRRSDTLYFAKIMAKVMSEQYDEQIGEVIPIPIHGINPALYDEAMDFFHNELSRLRLPKDTTTVYVFPTAGTPACSMALMLEGIARFGDRCEVIYQNLHNPKYGSLPIVSLGQKIFRRQTAVHLLQQFNFPAAAQACQQAGIHDPLVGYLLQYATARLWFAFDEAEQALRQAISHAKGQVRVNLVNMQDDLRALQERQPKALLGELYHNGRIAWENGRLLDFLTRWFRFQQTALALAVDQMPAGTFHEPVNKEDLADAKWRRMIIREMVNVVQPQSAYTLSVAQKKELSKNMQAAYSLSELKALCFDLDIKYENIAGDTLESKIIDFIQYCERRGLLFPLLQENQRKRPRIEWGIAVMSQSENNISRLVLALQRLEVLRPFYEQSILAAGVGGVTETAIVQAYTPSTASETGILDTLPLQDMMAVCSALSISAENPFRQIRDAIIEKLQA